MSDVDARSARAQTLSQKLRAWREERKSRFPTLTHLGNALEIPAPRWKSILEGRSLSSKSDDTEAYAKIFVATQIPESDPRTLPAFRRLMGERVLSTVEVAWSPSRYDKWLARNGGLFDLEGIQHASPFVERVKNTPGRQKASSKYPVVDNLSIGQTLDRFLETTVGPFIGSLMQQYMPRPSPFTQLDPTTVNMLVDKLSGVLGPITAASVQQIAPSLTELLIEELSAMSKEKTPTAHTVAKRTFPHDMAPDVLADQLIKVMVDLAKNRTVEDRNVFFAKHRAKYARLLSILSLMLMNESDRESQLGLVDMEV